MIPKSARATITALALGVAIALPAAATTGPATGNWAMWEGQDAAAPRAIYTQGHDASGALLACDNDGLLRALVTFKPGSVPKLLKRQVGYARGTEGVVSVGDDEPATGTFRYAPATKSLETRAHPIAARIFNRALAGAPIRIETEREGTIETVLPGPDATFRAFASTCAKLRDAQDG